MVDNKPAARQGWVIPILVSLAIILPQLIAIIPGASSVARTSSTEWLINGTIQSLSHVMLLAVIIGVSGRSREFGVYKPRPRDIPASALIFGGMLLIGRIIALIATNSGLLPDRSRFLGGNLSLAATLALAAGFSLASAYREELFYRAYLLGSFRQHSKIGRAHV